jgi:hypothetical protein
MEIQINDANSKSIENISTAVDEKINPIKDFSKD